MNKIHNHLGKSSVLTIDDIKWKPNPMPGFNRKKNLDVPYVDSPSIDTNTKKIWDYYFSLLFHRFDLMSRLKKNKTELESNAKDLHAFLFQDGNVNRNNLLSLLIKKPQENLNIINWEKITSPNAIIKTFDYDLLSDKTYTDEFVTLFQMLNVNVCPYCGRAFTTTIKSKDSNNARTCQVDHFYPQSKYPWLAISLWNLIPACGFCNLHKSDNTDDAILYPYDEGIGDLYRFTTHPTQGVGYLVGSRNSEEDFIVSLDSVVPHKPQEKLSDYEKRIDNEINMFKVNELYSTHNIYVCNIFRQRYILGDPYINSIFSSFKNMFDSPEDVRAMVYLKRINSESIGSNPLDKLTRDIDHEIDLLK